MLTWWRIVTVTANAVVIGRATLATKRQPHLFNVLTTGQLKVASSSSFDGSEIVVSLLTFFEHEPTGGVYFVGNVKRMIMAMFDL